MRVLRLAVVAQSAWSMTGAHAKHVECGWAGAQSVGDDGIGAGVLVSQISPQQPQRGASVALLLHDHVHNLGFADDSSPDVDVLASD